ncbi:MAG: hypothetical protein IJU33_02150 [Bacteroidales bacterium]|nr:hypothetical protein [Bacteroidales bacterium]
MKKKTVIPVVILSLTAAVVAIVLVLKRNGWKKYELTDEGMKWLQVYRSDGTELYYATGAERVKANLNGKKEIFYTTGGFIDQTDIFVPIKAIYWDEGKPKSFGGDAYILKEMIKTA